MLSSLAGYTVGVATAALVVAIQFTQTIGLGSIIVGALAGLAGLVVFLYGAKWRALAQIAQQRGDQLAKSLEEERARADRLEQQLLDTKELNAELRETVQKLEQLPNLAKVIELMDSTARHQDTAADDRLEKGLTRVEKAYDDRLAAHEEKAVERHEALLAPLAGMAADVARLVRAVERATTPPRGATT